MRKEAWMQKSAEDIRSTVLEILLNHKGFENFWFDLDEESQETIEEELDEAIEGIANEE
jgi:hypothetical protein